MHPPTIQLPPFPLYRFTQDSCTLTLHLPNTTDSPPKIHLFELTLTIHAVLESQSIPTPIVTGKTYKQLHPTYQITRSESQWTIEFQKIEIGDWPVLIQSNAENIEMDVHSAYLNGDMETAMRAHHPEVLLQRARFAKKRNSNKEGDQYLVQAAVAGNGDAAYMIARNMLERDEPALSKEWFEFTRKCQVLSVAIEEVFFGLGMCEYAMEDYHNARLHWEQSSSPRALHNLGSLYLNGRGVDRDIQRASALMTEAHRLLPELSIPKELTQVQLSDRVSSKSQRRVASPQHEEFGWWDALKVGGVVLGLMFLGHKARGR